MIEIRSLSKRFGNVTAVDSLDLSVDRGELVVLLGGSGCGKTTTLKMINRLVEPSSGEIRIGGEDTREVEPFRLRRRIGYGFQQVGLFPHLDVAANVAITPSLLGWEPARIDERVDDLLSLVRLEPDAFRNRAVGSLSGGERQRVGLARALAAEPEVLLLDEPFGALDPLTRDHLQEEFQRIRRGLGLTCLFVTHDMVEALLLGDRIAVMERGRLIQLGTPTELLANPANETVARLMQTPRRQAEAVDRLLSAGHRETPPL